MADIAGAAARAAEAGAANGTGAPGRDMGSLRAWIVANGGPALNDLRAQYAWVHGAPVQPPPPPESGGF